MAAGPIAFNDIVEVQIASFFEGQQYFNVLHFRCLQAPADPDYATVISNLLTTIETDVVTSIITPLKAMVGANVTISYLQGQRVYPGRDYYIREDLNTTGTADDAATGNVALSVTKQASRAGRGRSGRFQLAGVPGTALLNGGFTVAYLTLAEDLAQAIRFKQLPTPGQPDGTFEPGMWQRGAGVGMNWSSIVNTTVQKEVRTMHRRTLFLGI